MLTEAEIAGDAVGIVEVDYVKGVRLYVLPHLVERGAVKPRAGKSVINVFFDEHMAGRSNLFFQREHLTLDGALLRLQVLR